jgi:hypothetical protein
MKKAHVVENVALEVIPVDASTIYYPQELIDKCSEEVPDYVYIGAIRDSNGVWPGGPEPIKPACPTVSPVEFKLLFTSAERIAIKAARETDPIVEDFYSIVEDPRLTQVDLKLQSTQNAIDYLIAQNLVNADRKFSILNGELK